MSFPENKLFLPKNNKIPINKDSIIISTMTDSIKDEKEENQPIIRPIPINIKVLKKPKSELTTIGDSSLTIKNEIHELKAPIMHQNFNYSKMLQNGIYIEELNPINNINDRDVKENNSFSFKKEKLCCSCTKTRCIKKYCECFANNKVCIDCHCQNCMNKLTDLSSFQNNSISLKENEDENDKIICTCTKSNCFKKYCECFKIGKKCSNKCRCINCMNIDKKDNENLYNNNSNESINKNINNNIINDVLIKNNKNKINIEEKKIISSKSSESEILSDSFKIQRISVFINKYQTSINVEKLSKEDLNLLCKKRKQS